VGARFSHGGKDYEVVFDTDGDAGGRVKIWEDGVVLVDKELSSTVQQQQGLFGATREP